MPSSLVDRRGSATVVSELIRRNDLSNAVSASRYEKALLRQVLEATAKNDAALLPRGIDFNRTPRGETIMPMVPRRAWPTAVKADNPLLARVRGPLQAAQILLRLMRQAEKLPAEFVDKSGWDLQFSCDHREDFYSINASLFGACMGGTAFNPEYGYHDFPSNTMGGWELIPDVPIGTGGGYAILASQYTRSAWGQSLPRPWVSPQPVSEVEGLPLVVRPRASLTPLQRSAIAPWLDTSPGPQGDLPERWFTTYIPAKARDTRKLLAARVMARLASVLLYNATTEIRDGVKAIWRSIPNKDKKYWGSPNIQRMIEDIWLNREKIQFGPFYDEFIQLKGGKLVQRQAAKPGVNGSKPTRNNLPGEGTFGTGTGWDGIDSSKGLKGGLVYELAREWIQDVVYGSLGAAGARGAVKLNHSSDSAGRIMQNQSGQAGSSIQSKDILELFGVPK